MLGRASCITNFIGEESTEVMLELFHSGNEKWVICRKWDQSYVGVVYGKNDGLMEVERLLFQGKKEM